MGVGGTGFLSGVTAIAAGAEHTCAATSDGAVYCWGDNGGDLGNNSTTESNVPVQVVGVGGDGLLSGVKGIVAGVDYTCALTTDGAVYCWGDNSSGQLGNNSTESSTVPVQVVGVGGDGLLSGITAISAGGDFACALTTDGAVYCWGSKNLLVMFNRIEHCPGPGPGRRGRGQRIPVRCHSHRCRWVPHLRADHGRRHRLLGQQRGRSAWDSTRPNRAMSRLTLRASEPGSRQNRSGMAETYCQALQDSHMRLLRPRLTSI